MTDILDDSCVHGSQSERTRTHILVVEDNLDMQAFIYSIISKIRDNVVVDFASDGLSAIDYLTIRVPDLVITDLLMPGLSGIDLMARVQEVYGQNHVRFLLVTGGLTSDLGSGLTEASINSKYGCIVVRKPFRTSLLRKTVDELLKEAEDARSRIHRN